jgi:hypothetical protein
MAIFDRDYRSDEECEMIRKECLTFCDHVVVHWRKEIENFLLVPSALDRAAKRRISERTKRTGCVSAYGSSAAEVLMSFAIDRKSYVTAQVLETRRLFERSRSSAQHNAATTEAALMAFEDRWKMPEDRLRCIPGKEAVSAFNRHLQECYDVSVTPTSIIEAMHIDEVPTEIRDMIQLVSDFANLKVVGTD